jgi:very-short-patch-repair endonuclease
MVASGIRLLRFTAGDIYNNPEKVVAQVRAMLATAAGERSSATSRGSQIA